MSRTSVRMTVMHIRIVRMTVHHARMNVRMDVGFLTGPRK